MKVFRLVMVLIALLIMVTACGDGTSVFALEVGDCFDYPGSDDVTEIETFSCDEPHDYEVFYVGDLVSDGPYPGDTDLYTMVRDLCLPQFDPYVGRDYLESSLDWDALFPTLDGWTELDDRGVVCLLFDLNLQKLTGTARNSGL